LSSSIRGTVLAGRYRLEERIHTNPDGSVWRAIDSTLDRTVSVRVMRPNHPFAADVADAARRAALIDDVRLVRVLDVGSDGEVGFVVSEDVDGDTLATLVERSPLFPPAVRRIIGEVAQGLDGAAGRGLHHLRLTPRSVIVCRDGTVKISGTAVEAAAAGLEPDHAATASRVDAVSLVALLYSGLTGRWPLGDAGFPPAPRGEGGGPVPPADLVPGVPNDLDTLCVVTLGAVDDGPRSPAELVRELAPWPSSDQAPLRPPGKRLPVEAPAKPNPSSGIQGRPFTTKRSTPRHPSSASTEAPIEAGSETAPQTGSEAVAAPAKVAPAKGTAKKVAPKKATPARAAPAAAAAASLFSPAAAATPATPARSMDSLFTPPANQPAAAAQSRAIPPAPPKDTPPARAVPRRGSGGSRGSGNNPGPETEPLSLWGAGWTNGSVPSSPLETTGPFPIIIPPEAPPREQSRLVIVSVGAVLLLVLVVAAFSLRDFGSSDKVTPSDANSPLPTVSAAPLPTAAATSTAPTAETTTASPSPSAAAPIRIDTIRAIDPQGDGDEDSALSKLAIDDDPSTFWKSDTYRSSTFGGLKKGVGLALKLKTSAAVQSATIQVEGFGGAVELRTADSTDLDSSTVVGKGTFKNGQVTVRADNASPSKYVILWFTKLPSVGGKYKIEVSEVQLK
jgi:hypothetical protein